MKRELNQWFSPSLNKDMPIASYGHYGFALLLIPTAAADYLEYERFQLIDEIAQHINDGKCKVFSIDSINRESWLNDDMHPPHKAIRQNQFNDYVINEVIPFIKSNTSPDTPIITCGASFGALHAMNLFLRHPDKINGVISMSGVYDLKEYTKGYWDDQVYFNSPETYIQNMNDEWYLQKIRQSNQIHLLSGSGSYEDPNASKRFSNVLNSKGIEHTLDIWGNDIDHDWPTWRKMLPFVLSKF